MKTYIVQVCREGSAWTAKVEGVQGAQTWARGLRHLEDSVREAVILADDLDDDAQFGLDWVYLTGDSTVDREAQRIRDRRRDVSSAAEELADETGQLVHLLRERGFSIRDAAAIAGVSPARVGQLATAK